MSAATQKPDENAMADDERDERDDRPESDNDRGQQPEYRAPSTKAGATDAGFFHIYKSGQGYWTRMGTVAGAGLVAIFTTMFIYNDLRPRIPYLRDNPKVALGIALAFLAVAGLAIFWFVNRPRTADFLIATDSEMKKVNWTSRKELLGSTRIVILFMFLIAGLLFGIDIAFGYVFYWMGILKNPPF
jgi:preprotein translocase SecE subunit